MEVDVKWLYLLLKALAGRSCYSYDRRDRSPSHRRNNRRDRGRLVPQLLGWGTNNVLVPKLLGRSFQEARNFTASSHQNAGFSIWVFKNFPGVIPRTLTAGGATLSGTQHSARLLAGGAGRPGVGTQTLVPLNFSAVVAPLVRPEKNNKKWSILFLPIFYRSELTEKLFI